MNSAKVEESKPHVNQLLFKALEKTWNNYRTELERCRDEFSNEAVHDLRVATRRILAFIELLNSISPRPRYQKMRRAFKDQLDEFDEVRDTQVILAEISETIQELPQLLVFQRHLQDAEEKLLRDLRKKIKKFEASELDKRIRKTEADIKEEVNDDLESQAMQAVDDAYLLTHQRLGWVDSSRAATIHRVRIAFKSFRYMVEIVHPLLPDFPTENLKRMDRYQSLMGEIQDVEVFIQTLADFSEDVSIQDLEAVRRYYENRHTQAISAYLQEKNQLQIFWRPAPDQPFPWENPA